MHGALVLPLGESPGCASWDGSGGSGGGGSGGIGSRGPNPISSRFKGPSPLMFTLMHSSPSLNRLFIALKVMQ